MTYFPGKEDKMYKTMRHHLRTKDYQSIRSWPSIDKNVMTQWKNNPVILIPSGCYAGTKLKAFNGAPVWTVEEINLFCEIVAKYGIKCTKLPKKGDTY